MEVKGTTGDGSQVLLIAGEVRHAHTHGPDVALFILAGIELRGDSETALVVSGRRETIYEPWAIHGGNLKALAYAYRPLGG